MSGSSSFVSSSPFWSYANQLWATGTFRPPTPQWGCLAQFNEFANKAHHTLTWETKELSKAPSWWSAVAIWKGEKLLQYKGGGPTKKAAEEDAAAQLIEYLEIHFHYNDQHGNGS